MQENKGFFAVDWDAIEAIYRGDRTFEAMGAYLILAKHTKGNGKDPHTASTAGAKAVAKYSGMSHRRAENAIQALLGYGLVELIEIKEGGIKQQKPRYRLREPQDPLYLPHSLIQGVTGSGEPLRRIYDQLGLAPYKNIKSARAAALWMLMLFYRHDSMVDYGGINPAFIHRTWSRHEEEEPWQRRNVLFTPMTPDGTHNSNSASMDEFFTDLRDDEPDEYFWFCAQELKRLGFCYDVIQLWDSNPIQDVNAEVLYPVHVFDKDTNDPYLSRNINSVIEGDVDYPPYYLRSTASEEPMVFYVASSGGGHLVGSLRLRFRGATAENGRGFESQEIMVERWKEFIHSF